MSSVDLIYLYISIGIALYFEPRMTDSESDENDEYLKRIHFQSIRASHGLETAISVQWDGMESPIILSTLLEEDDLAPLFAGAQWAGTRVWHAAIAMIQYLTTKYTDLLKQEQCQLLELGCGLGVPGMICHSLYQTNTYLTDQESIMSQLRNNVQQQQQGVVPQQQDAQLHVRALDWSRDAVRDLIRETGPFDIVINCDCVYEPLYGDSWKLLADVMEELLRVNPKALMLTSCERRPADSIDQFLERLQTSKYISSVETVWTDPKFNIEIYHAKGIERL